MAHRVGRRAVQVAKVGVERDRRLQLLAPASARALPHRQRRVNLGVDGAGLLRRGGARGDEQGCCGRARRIGKLSRR